MRYLFHVHRHLPAWRLVTGEGFSLPAGHSIDDWEHTRTREEDDTTPDVRREVRENGYSLFKLGGELADVEREMRRLRSAADAALPGGQLPTPEPIAMIDVATKLALIDEHWCPKIIAALNGQEVKLVTMLGTFVWHHHEREDELFLGIEGRFRIEFRERAIEVGPGQLVVVPRGVEHRTVADERAAALVFEPAATRNTGNLEHPELTAPDGVRI